VNKLIDKQFLEFDEDIIRYIETVTMEAEMNVLTSLMNCYEKQAMILENSHLVLSELSSYEILQEEFILENDSELSLKNTIIRWIDVVVRWIHLAISSVLELFKYPTYKKLINEVKRLDDNVSSIVVPKCVNKLKHRMDILIENTNEFIQLIKYKNTNTEDFEKLETNILEINDITKDSEFDKMEISKEELLRILEYFEKFDSNKSLRGLLKNAEFNEESFRKIILNEGKNVENVIWVIKSKAKEIAHAWRLFSFSFKNMQKFILKGVRAASLSVKTSDVFSDTKTAIKRNKNKI